MLLYHIRMTPHQSYSDCEFKPTYSYCTHEVPLPEICMPMERWYSLPIQYTFIILFNQALYLDRTWFLEIGPSAVIRLDAKHDWIR